MEQQERQNLMRYAWNLHYGWKHDAEVDVGSISTERWQPIVDDIEEMLGLHISERTLYEMARHPKKVAASSLATVCAYVLVKEGYIEATDIAKQAHGKRGKRQKPKDAVQYIQHYKQIYLHNQRKKKNSITRQFVGYAFYDRTPQERGVYEYQLQLQSLQQDTFTATLRFDAPDNIANTTSKGNGHWEQHHMYLTLTPEKPTNGRYFLILHSPAFSWQDADFFRGVLLLPSKNRTIVATQIFFVTEESASQGETQALLEQLLEQESKEIRISTGLLSLNDLL